MVVEEGVVEANEEYKKKLAEVIYNFCIIIRSTVEIIKAVRIKAYH